MAMAILGMGCARTQMIAVSEDVAVIDFSAERRGAYILHGTGKPTVFSEPSPDVAVAFKRVIEGGVTAIPGGPGEVQAKIDLAKQIVDLANRSQTLQIQREALYRLVELSANGCIDKNNVDDLYLKVLETISVIALTELTNSVDKLAKSKLPESEIAEWSKKIREGTILKPVKKGD